MDLGDVVYDLVTDRCELPPVLLGYGVEVVVDMFGLYLRSTL